MTAKGNIQRPVRSVFLIILKPGLTMLSGFLVVVLNVSSGQNTADNSSTTAAPSTFPALPRTMIPVTGYGHFNVSNCILLDVSCSVSVDLHVDKEVY